MSKLRVTSRELGTTYALNCTAFTAPIAASITSVQTRTLTQHFPVKVNQPEAEFDIVFANENDFEHFQQFARANQIAAQSADSTSVGVVLYWPERNIMNWTGTIKTFRAGGQRANVAPRAKLEISLLSSMVATTTNIASIASNWMTIFGLGMPDGVLSAPLGILDGLLNLFGNGASLPVTPLPTGAPLIGSAGAGLVPIGVPQPQGSIFGPGG